ncbi:MAG: hypothetical protein ACE5JX_20495 [Acidobacteriota bacterium]
MSSRAAPEFVSDPLPRLCVVLGLLFISILRRFDAIRMNRAHYDWRSKTGPFLKRF